MRYTQKGSFVGKRIEIGPHLDLWMRGARTGVVAWQSTAHKPGELMRLKVRMDHPQVKRLAVIHVSDIGKMLEGPPEGYTIEDVGQYDGGPTGWSFGRPDGTLDDDAYDVRADAIIAAWKHSAKAAEEGGDPSK